MSSYILRDVDRELWRQAKMRAAEDELPLRAVILRLLAMYAAGEITIKTERSDHASS